VEFDVDKGAASAHYAVLKIPSAWWVGGGKGCIK
jgi:hypothetical protein